MKSARRNDKSVYIGNWYLCFYPHFVNQATFRINTYSYVVIFDNYADTDIDDNNLYIIVQPESHNQEAMTLFLQQDQTVGDET